MFEELKTIVDMIAHLPTLAVWVLAGLLLYKLAIIGSIYGFLRFAIEKVHHYLITVATKPLPRKEAEVDISGVINGMCITVDGSHKLLIGQLERIKGKGVRSGSPYIHDCSVQWLRKAIDAAEAKEYEDNFSARADASLRGYSQGISNVSGTGGSDDSTKQAK